MIGRQLVEVIFSGLTIGVVYYLIAVGFTLAYGVGRVMNFSYGSFFTWGGYLAWVFLVGYFELGYVVVVLLVAPIMFVVFGLGVDRGIVRPLRRRPEFELDDHLGHRRFGHVPGQLDSRGLRAEDEIPPAARERQLRDRRLYFQP